MARAVGRVLLARVGWMTYYGRIDDKHDRLVGGGSWNDHSQGSEMYNFKPIPGARGGRGALDRLYGYVQPGKGGRLALRRMDESIVEEQGEFGGVTVIFVATDQNASQQTERQRIVGWYKRATVYRNIQGDPTRMREHCDYNLTADARNAVLLPTHLRKQPIPRSKPGAMGQSNVWYPLDEDGAPRNPRWLMDALSYVDSYSGDNLINNPGAELAQAEQTELERVAGFESNQRIRIAVEEHAMKIVMRHYKRLHFQVEDTHKIRPYDLECTKGGRRRYIEVKGTRTLGHQVLSTPNEVKLPDRKGAVIDLCIVHSVKVTVRKQIKCNGGKLLRYENWHPRDHDLRPVSFICEFSESISRHQDTG